ncbi:MAG: hypothetical protein QXG57_08025 [Thermofilaceae archaeon]
MAARAVRLLKLSCPQCGRESTIQVGEDALVAAASSPTGLIGVAEYHGDHVFVVYVDGEGRDRGVRVFRTLQRGEVIRVTPTYLSYMSNLSGFRVLSEGWSVECFAGNPRALLRVQGERGALEAELKDLSKAAQAISWGESLLSAVARVGQLDPSGLLLSILLMDASIPYPPSPFAPRMFEIAMKARRLVVKVDPGAAELLRAYINRITWLSSRMIDFALSVNGWRLIDAVVGPDPLTIRERLSALISLERRGVVGFEEVGS